MQRKPPRFRRGPTVVLQVDHSGLTACFFFRHSILCPSGTIPQVGERVTQDQYLGLGPLTH